MQQFRVLAVFGRNHTGPGAGNDHDLRKDIEALYREPGRTVEVTILADRNRIEERIERLRAINELPDVILTDDAVCNESTKSLLRRHLMVTEQRPTMLKRRLYHKRITAHVVVQPKKPSFSEAIAGALSRFRQTAFPQQIAA